MTIDLDRLAATDEEVRALSQGERFDRVALLVEEAYDLLEAGIEKHITAESKECAGIVVLFSGGNDSTVLAHLFKHRATHAAHANTTIGVEQTREFVRQTCAAWDLPLLEFSPPRVEDHYRSLVLEQGFPGPGHHYKMFQRLKERSLRVVRNELVQKKRSRRVVFLAGRRRQESGRRANVPEFEREGSVVWVSPLVNWTAADMSLYRDIQGDVPRNEVSDLIHMSGECLCGSFAAMGEREELAMWFPDVIAEITALEAEIADRDDIPDLRKTWGWGADPEVLKTSRSIRKVPKTGRLCSTCDVKHAHLHEQTVEVSQ